MKISGQQAPSQKELSAGQSKQAKGLEGDQAQGKKLDPTAGGSVKTSSFAMDKIKNGIAAEPEVRADRVAELKAQIKDGTYAVDADKLAGKMLKDSALEDL